VAYGLYAWVVAVICVPAVLRIALAGTGSRMEAEYLAASRLVHAWRILRVTSESDVELPEPHVGSQIIAAI
jgi:hypothetical protein